VATLNSQQQQAVRYIDGPVLVLAGAGSGKTSVITQKIAWLVNSCGLDAQHIFAVTFTNKAAREMKARVGKLMSGGGKAQGLNISTFHTLGLSIIRQHHRVLGYKPGFSIFDGDDTLRMLKDCLLEHGKEQAEQAPLVQQLISNWKNELVTPEQALSQADSPGEQRAALIYQQYQQLLKTYNAVDFDDLIAVPVHLLRNNPEVLAQWHGKVRYMLVDEYQDTNGAQYELVKLLVGLRRALTAVGDDDQSIYSWRGARPENLVQLQTDFPDLEVIKLEQNYRSTVRILGAANQVISNNPHVFDKRLWSELGHGEPVRIIQCPDDEAELDRVVTEIVDQRLRKGLSWEDFAILYRGNHQARPLEIKLQQHDVPYHISGGTSFFARNEIKDMMSYLRLLINPDDDNAFLRIVNVPRRKIGPGTLEALGHYANGRHCSLYQAANELGFAQQANPQGVARLREFVSFMDRYRQQSQQGNPITAIREMIEGMHYQAWCFQNTASPTAADRRMQNVYLLVDSLRHGLAEDGSDIAEAVSKLILRDMLEQQEEDDRGERVQLMTLHAAKGLEFPHVFILGMEENLLPHRNSIEQGDIEEERRLCYVGITRAQQTLTMTLARRRKQFGEAVTTTPSRFIDELPAADLVREGFGEKDPERNAVRGKATIASLKGLLADL
jgi:ATP-dependent DNA helicase Rep